MHKVLRRATVGFDRLLDYLVAFAAILLVAATLIVATDITLRKVFHSPLIWSVEYCGYIVAWLAFLPAAWILRRDQHVKIELLTSHLKAKVQMLVHFATSLIGAFVCLVLTVGASVLVWSDYEQGTVFFSLTAPPKAPLMGIVPFCSLLLVIQFLRRSYGYIRCWSSMVRLDKDDRNRGGK